MKKKWLLLLLLAVTMTTFGQTKKITIERIWDDFYFYPRGVAGYTAMPKSDYYTVVKRGGIERYSFATGDRVDVIVSNEELERLSGGTVNMGNVSSYEFTSDESKIVLAIDEESIWRRSTLAFYYVYDIALKTLTLVADTNTKLHFAVLTEDGSKVLFARDCDLFCQDLSTGKITPITHDGKPNAILNGYADWVYEEELDMSRAASFSPDGTKIAYLRFDESRVKEYTIPMYDGLYPTDFKYKYPKAGEDNSLVEVHIYDLATGAEVHVQNQNDRHPASWRKETSPVIVKNAAYQYGRNLSSSVAVPTWIIESTSGTRTTMTNSSHASAQA